MRKIDLAILIIYIFQAFWMGDCFPEEVEVAQPSLQGNDIKLDQMFRSEFLTKDGKCISSWVTSVNDISDERWAYLASNSKRIFRNGKVDTVVLRDGYLSLEIMNFLTTCQNIDHLTLGEIIDGCICPKNAFHEIRKLKKLNSLEVAIFGLNDDFLSVLAELQNLEYLTITFPSLIVAPNDFKIEAKKGNVLLTDKAIQNIVRVSNLKWVRIGGDNNAGKARFSIEGLNELLTLKKLESVDISSSCFSEEELKILRRSKLPQFVKIR